MNSDAKKVLQFICLDSSAPRRLFDIRNQRRTVDLEEPLRDIDKSTEFRIETVSNYDDEEFSRHFRMERDTFRKLLSRLSPYLPKPYHGFGQYVIPPDERLCIALWFLASSETYRALACRFGTSESVIHESVDMILNAIDRELAGEVTFPSCTNQCRRIAADFHTRNGYPNIIGAIDGTHIKIRKPADEPDVWIDRQGHYSIAVAAIVDKHKRFTHYSIGCPGSMHDQRVLRLSTIEELLAAIPDTYHLIGDSAYALTTKMMVPYKDNGRLTARQKSFNYRHSSNRMVIENAFGLLKNKFTRIHSTLIVTRWHRAVSIIKSCIHLHNFIINCESVVEPLEPREDVNLPSDPHQKRDVIAALIE